ncbi:MAG: DNA repair protein RecN [Bacillota bacterium]|nr:DNA repair protein RecN [Bacillota bacterium]
MLVELRVNNFALIEDLTFNFNSGLNVLSGETGAGKSIVIGAINLLLGDRAAVDQIRQGCEEAYVEGIICCSGFIREETDRLLSEAGIESDEELFLAREVYRSGRSIARVNGRAVPVSFLKELGKYLIDLHGQHQHQSLLRPEQHLELLDSFGGEEIGNLRVKLEELHKKSRDKRKELSLLGENSAERERKLDIYSFQIQEIRAAALINGEDDELLNRERLLANVEKISIATAKVYENIYAGEESGMIPALTDSLRSSEAMLAEAAKVDPDLNPLVELLGSASTQLEEAAHELRNYQEKLEFEPGELNSIQERLNLINTLKRKYGSTIGDIQKFAEQSESEMERLKNSEAVAAELEEEIRNLEKEMYKISLLIHSIRVDTAKVLESKLEECLDELALPNARFEVKIEEKENITPKGLDHVEFLFSANPGEEVKPLAKIISGGEVSRVMLALKSILARQDVMPTLVFDEVDAGIGGVTIQAVAEKLASLAIHHQVMCVTHSPQIAVMADRHFRLFKEKIGARTITCSEIVVDQSRREELARMLDGAGIDQVGLMHVDSLLERAERFKKESVR